jgi:ubiquinone/menaquinone biosynthesis C-methylase UbiE
MDSLSHVLNPTGFNPEYYDKYLGQAWFNAFAEDLAQRLPARPPGDVLELACGTGMVTRRLRERLDPALRLVASDLSKAMLTFAHSRLIDRRGIEWREADAASLPFDDGEFGAVVCGFGVMFFPDKSVAMREARRILKEGGVLLFNVWDRIERNPHAEVCAQVLEDLFPGDEEIGVRKPYEMYQPALLRPLLAQARFQEVRIEQKRMQVQGVSARSIAIGLIRGTPRSLLIEKRGVPLDEVVERVTAALAKAGGADPYIGPASAVVVEACAA